MLQIVRVSEDRSYMQDYPQWQVLFESIREPYDYFVTQVQQVYDQHKHIQDKKDFSRAIKKYKFDDAVFALTYENSKHPDREYTARQYVVCTFYTDLDDRYYSTSSLSSLKKWMHMMDLYRKTQDKPT
jgi:hypothetical protein